jgi:hypothetical protein
MVKASPESRDRKQLSPQASTYFLRPGVVVIEEEPGKFIVKGSTDAYSFDRLEDDEGPGLLPTLLARLERGVTIQSLASESDRPIKEIQTYVEQLVTAGVAEIGPPESPNSSFGELIRQIRLDSRGGPKDLVAEGRDVRLTVLDLAHIGFDSDLRRLEVPGVEISSEPPDGSSRSALRVVVADVGQLTELLDLNRRLLPARLPIIYVLLDGSNALLFDVLPYRTPCVEDLLLFYDRNALLPLTTGSGVAFKERLPLRRVYQRNFGDCRLIRSLLAPFVAFDALHLRFAGEGLLSSRLLRIHLATLEMNVVNLLVNPRCSSCGSGNMLPTNIVGDPRS